jgi:HEAT repeat protein
MVTMSWVLAAVTFGMQQPAAAPVPPVPPLPQVPSVGRLETELPALGVRLGELFSHGELSELAALSELSSLESLRMLGDLSSLGSLQTLGDFSDAAVVWIDQDPGDSLYRAARRLLNRGRYADAGAAFADLIRRYPRSDYTPDAYYWRAFALYKTGDVGNYREARTVLEYQERHFRNAATRGEAETLYARIQGELAQQGDPRAAEWVRRHATAVGSPTPSPSPTPTPPATVIAPVTSSPGSCPSGDDDDDPRMAAIGALLQMDPEAAVPILKQVLARRDPCSVVLRRKAVFIISQKRAPDTEDVLLTAARTDPDAEVRQQAVFWLSQVGSERAVSALDSILHSSTDEELQSKAIFALSQIHSPRAGQILRDFALQSGASDDARQQAIFWLGQQHSAENAAFLRDLYARVTSDDLKEKVIFSLSQMGGAENARWLLDLATNEREPVEMRKKALFWAGQTGAELRDLTAIYDRTTNMEIKEQLIFVYSQRRESDAVDKLIDIAKNDPNRELRKKAVFWLGQSRDPRARQALLDIINQ